MAIQFLCAKWGNNNVRNIGLYQRENAGICIKHVEGLGRTHSLLLLRQPSHILLHVIQGGKCPEHIVDSVGGKMHSAKALLIVECMLYTSKLILWAWLGH